MEKEENILGTEKISKLLRKFSIPCIISLVVSALYNIVDQIFIGWGVGYYGNGATNVVYPLTVIAFALTFMFGDGASAYMSLKLGEKKKDEASKGVINGFILACIFGLILTLVFNLFLLPLLNLFGCTDGLREYAIEYGRIIVSGMFFFVVGSMLNGVIRADGNPKFAMISMVGGAILNCILDPICIFVFNWGVQGAAIATVISEFFTFILNLLYIKKFKTIDFKKEYFKFDLKIASKVCLLGVSSFITQTSIVLLIAVQNNLLKKYGEESIYGSDIPITVMGIVMKINQILNSIILGIAVGAQPIFGYNYGAGKFDRVKKALKYVLAVSLTVSTTALILFQTIPDKLISIFGSGNELYIEFACKTFRTFLKLCIVYGISLPTGIFFQSIGKSIKSAVISILRQVGVLIPMMIICSSIWGLDGILYAGPITDCFALILTSSLLSYEVVHLGKKKVKSEALIDDTSTDNKLSKKVTIAIAREYGSGGRYVGRLIADKLGIKLYDKDFIIKLAKETGLSEEYIEDNEQKVGALSALNNGYYFGMDNNDDLFIKESEMIKKVSDEESCVIVGRCANFILKDRPNVVKIFIYSDMESKVNRAVEFYGLDRKNAEKEIKKRDKDRIAHYKFYTDWEWKDSSKYDLCLNADILGVEKTSELICDYIKEFEKTL